MPDVSVHRKLPRQAIAVAAIVAIAGCGVPGPEGPADSFGVDFTMPDDAAVRGAIVFFVDGVNGRIFAEMLAAGELPAIRRYFVDRGLYVTKAAASTPSVTLANQTSIVTGRFPGRHNITGVNWFDRNRLIWRNYETIAQKNTLDADYLAPTLFEQFPDRTTFSIFFQAHRGATKFIENWTSAGPPFFFGWYEFVDRLTLYRFGEVMDIARTRGRFPAVTFAYLLAPDFRAYGNGVGSEPYREAIRHTDRQIGRVLGDVERAGLLDEIIIAFVSDHSLMDVTEHFPMEPFLREQMGIDLARRHYWESTGFEDRLEYYRKFHAVAYGSGDRYWALCLRRPVRGDDGSIEYEPWPVRPTAADLRAYPARDGPVDLPAALAAVEQVDVVAYAVAPGRVRVRRGCGEVEFRQDHGPSGSISYHLVSGDDPFGWEGHVPAAMLDGTAHTPRQWLDATIDTEYPDLPPQIAAYFRAGRAGDIALFAAPGVDFTDSYAAGHGGLRPGDMLSPLLLAGPGVPHETRPVARTVDLMPTLLGLLGRPIPPGLDGGNLIP